jgi:hypothetical protein
MKSRRGAAYILVIVAALVALAMVLTVLTVTAASRNITARYADFYGLYDIAVAANERAFAALENAMENGELIFDDFFELMRHRCWHSPQCWDMWRYDWTLGINLGDEQSDFFAVTTICYREPVFYIETHVSQTAPYAPVAVVRKSAIFLDCYTLVMLELFRVAY